MSLPAALVGESVEDAERRFSEPKRKPSDRCRFLLDERKTTAKKVFYFCLFSGFCLQSNPQSEFYCVSHGFLLKSCLPNALTWMFGNEEGSNLIGFSAALNLGAALCPHSGSGERGFSENRTYTPF